jgi:orotidine-5'-phosphate decarboxylase
MNPNRIIVALDVETADEARGLIAKLGDAIDFYKVGMELYAASGMEIVRELEARGKNVFLDLKYYDIPETVKRAVAQVAKTGVRFLTIHGSVSIMRAAVEGRGTSELELLAVTVLTSFGPEDMQDMGFGGSISDLVEHRARKAVECGIDGLIASPLDAAALRRIVPAETVLVTPGVRSQGAAKADQKRVATPAEAVRDGADYVVIGRQITRAADPAGEAERVRQEIADAVKVSA